MCQSSKPNPILTISHVIGKIKQWQMQYFVGANYIYRCLINAQGQALTWHQSQWCHFQKFKLHDTAHITEVLRKKQHIVARTNIACLLRNYKSMPARRINVACMQLLMHIQKYDVSCRSKQVICFAAAIGATCMALTQTCMGGNQY